MDLLIGGVKERPIAYKMGVAFCDHNHERKIALAGFEGMLNFCKEVHDSIMSPVWEFSPAWQRRMDVASEPTGEVEDETVEALEHAEERQEPFVSTQKRMQALRASRCEHRLQGDRGMHPPGSRLPGLLDLYPSLRDQPFQRAHRHRVVQLQRVERNIRRRRQPENSPRQRHPPIRPGGYRHRHHLPLGNHRRRRPSLPRPVPEIEEGREMPAIIHASTPSYRGTHMEGYHEAVRAPWKPLPHPASAMGGST